MFHRSPPPSRPTGAGTQFAALLADVARTVGGRFAAVAVLATLAAVAEGAGLLLLMPLLDLLGVTGDGDGSMPMLRAFGQRIGLGGALVLYVLLIAGASAVVWARMVAGTALLLDYVDALRQRLHDAVMAMSWPALAARRQADLTHALTQEVAQCGSAVHFLLQMLTSLVQVPALIVAAFLLSPAFTVAALLLAGALALAVRPLSRRAYALGHALAETRRALNAEIADQTAGLRILKALGAEEARGAEFRNLAGQARDRQLAQARASATARLAQRVAAAGAAALAVWAGLGPLGLPLPEMLVLLALFARLMPAALRVQETWRIILQTLPVHGHLLASLEDWRRQAEPAPVEAPPTLTRSIALSGVGYRHAARADGPPALDGITAAIPAKRTTALVGPSGAGKSTLADIVMGLVAPDEGAVLVDGVPLDGPARVAWRRRIGYVPQDPFLFHRTIRENLALARPGADEAELWRALEEAAVADTVRTLPQGLDTVVGDRGARLSGGERQRIALARALLRRPDLLVLDEATASLDAETEGQVADTLRRLHGRLTVLVVAHRPSTVRAADHVLVLEGGRLLAGGSWTDVRAMAGDRLAALDMSG